MAIGLNISGELPEPIRMMDAGYRRGVAKQKLQMLAPLMQYMSPEQRTTLTNSPAFQQIYKDAGIGELPPFEPPKPSALEQARTALTNQETEYYKRKTNVVGQPKQPSLSEWIAWQKYMDTMKHGKPIKTFTTDDGRIATVYAKDGKTHTVYSDKRVAYTIPKQPLVTPEGMIYTTEDPMGVALHIGNQSILLKEKNPYVLAQQLDTYLKGAGVTDADKRNELKNRIMLGIMMKYPSYLWHKSVFVPTTAAQRRKIQRYKEAAGKAKGQGAPPYGMNNQDIVNKYGGKVPTSYVDAFKSYGGAP